MQDITDQQLEEAFEKAPVAVQDSLSGGAATQFILAARERYVLNVDVVGKLSLKIRDLMLGFLSPADFYASLLEFGIAIDAAKKITNDINTEIFLPIRSELEGKPASSERVALPPQVVVKEEAPEPMIAPVLPAPEVAPALVPVIAQPHQPMIQQPFHATAMHGQPAATVHVYVHPPIPIPVAPPITAPVSHEVSVAEVPPAPIQPSTAPSDTPSVRPLPQPPVNLPGILGNPIDKEYGSDPYREPIS